ncbi:MAG: hypothetical protein IPO67_15825 [Deltaproteobacteria bacterium]|nr:hypothetical protein [Deltaproteobacteria bacterium]
MIQIKPRLTALGALTLLTACEPPPPPPLSATPIVWAHKGCGERGLPVTITTAPGAEVVGLGSGEPPEVRVGPFTADAEGKVSFDLTDGDITPVKIAASFDGGRAELPIDLPDHGFLISGVGDMISSQCATHGTAAEPGCEVTLYAGPQLTLKGAPVGAVLRFGDAQATVTDANKGVELEINPSFALAFDLAAIQGKSKDACRKLPVTGLSVTMPDGVVFDGPAWVSAYSGRGAFVQGLGLAVEGPIGPAEATGDVIAVLKRLDDKSTYNLERYEGGEPATLSDVRYVAALTVKTGPAESCGIYSADNGEGVEVFKYDRDLLAVVVERATGRRVAERVFQGPEASCGGLSVGGRGFWAELPSAEAWIQAEVAKAKKG